MCPNESGLCESRSDEGSASSNFKDCHNKRQNLKESASPILIIMYEIRTSWAKRNFLFCFIS